MKPNLKLVFSFLLAVFIFTGCEEEPSKPEPVETATALFVLNVSATTISVVDLETGTVTNDVATTGTWPNQIVYRNDKLYIVNSGTNNIQIFSTDTWQEETPIALGDGNNPMNMVFTDDITAYVACSMSNQVLEVDVSSKTITRQIDAGLGTTGITYSNGKVYAANTAYDGSTWTYGQGTVTVINPGTGAVSATINVATNPQAIAVAPDGRLHIACSGNWFDIPGQAVVIDPTTDAVAGEVATGGTPGLIAISDADDLAYMGVWGMGALVYNTATLAQVHDTSDYFLGKGGTGLVADPDGNIFISVWNDDQVIQLNSGGTVLATYNVGDSPGALALKVTVE